MYHFPEPIRRIAIPGQFFGTEAVNESCARVPWAADGSGQARMRPPAISHPSGPMPSISVRKCGTPIGRSSSPCPVRATRVAFVNAARVPPVSKKKRLRTFFRTPSAAIWRPSVA